MSVVNFSKKRINVSFALANGNFGSGGNNYVATGLRISCHVEVVGGPTQNKCELVIFGLPLDIMNQLSTAGRDYNKMYQNSVSVEAGSDEEGMTLVFAGSIAYACADLQAMPQGCFRVVAAPGVYFAVKPSDVLSYKGPTDAAGVMQQLAGKMGLAFENNGVNVKLSNPYYAGTAWTQMLNIARDGGFDVIVDRGKMAVLPPDKTRKGGATLIAPGEGLIRYPGFNEAYVLVEAYFDPNVQYGGEIEIRSALTSACGLWKVNRLEYELESEMPHGKWSMLITGVMIGPTVS